MGETSTTSPRIEVEAKLALAWDGAPRTREDIGPIPGYRVLAHRAQRIRSTYVDTADRSLSRLGMTLRLRSAAGRASLEATWPGTVEGAVWSRPRLEVPLASASKIPTRLPDGPLTLPLGPCVARRRLIPIVTADLRRERLLLLREGGVPAARAVAEIALDRVRYRFEGNQRTSGEFREIEVRALEAEAAEIAEIAGLLAARFRLEPSVRAKAFRALAAHPNGPLPPPIADEQLTLDTPVDRAARVILARQLRILRENDPGTRLGEDPERLHDLRVAVRRLRAALRAFAVGIPARVRERLGEELRWLGGLLGPARDLDVRIARLAEIRLALPESQRGALAGYGAYLSEERELRRVEMLAGIESARYWRLLVRLERITSSDAGAGGRLVESLGHAGHRSLRRLADRLSKAGKDAANERSPEALHRLRIRAKRLRYVLGFLEEALGKPAHRSLRSLARIQDALGTHRDAVVAAETLSRYGREIEPALEREGLLSIGALIGMESARAERALRDFDEAWKRWTSKRARKELADVLARAGR